MRQIFFLIYMFAKTFLAVTKEQVDKDESCDLRCSDDILVKHLASCEILSPESIINLSVKEIELLCRKLDDTIKEIEKYLKTCVPPPPTNLFMSYISGMRVLNIRMCSAESNFLKRFAPFYPCLHELKSEYDGCSGPADWTEDTDINKVCKTYKNIADCYYIKSAKVCGVEAATTMKELVTDIINNILCVTCKGIGANPLVKDAMPAQYIKKNAASSKVNFSITFILLLHFIYFRKI